MDSALLDKALRLLEARLRQAGAEPQHIVVCGGVALILAGLVPRATSDVDVVALMRAGTLVAGGRRGGRDGHGHRSGLAE